MPLFVNHLELVERSAAPGAELRDLRQLIKDDPGAGPPLKLSLTLMAG
jgi:hypothetical protein